ncbi:MAG: hypothetical protein ACRD0H_29715, partial [Actinomycetes bacterium]
MALLATLTAASVLVAPAFSGMPAARATAPRAPAPTYHITVNASGAAGRVNPAVLGSAYSASFAGMGSFDARTDRFYPGFIRQLQQVAGHGSLRFPGGIPSESYHWERAIGPESRRTPNAAGPHLGPSPSSVGPDEFGHLLDAAAAQGVVAVNFGTGTAAEAAAFVQYMTGRAGTSAWADLRARNGHVRPYNVPYWEVGNEEFAVDYWRLGTPVRLGRSASNCLDVDTCLYIYGGSTRFGRQRVVGYANRTPAAAVSTGRANQAVYAAYPPVSAPETVYVAGHV